MVEYQFYLLNEDDRDVARQDYCCADDQAAMEVARSLCLENRIDVWSQARRVARIGQSEFAFGRRP
jgi:hypothetical protein